MANEDPFVIIGASHAGVQLAVSLRETGYSGVIELYSDEPHTPYHRPPLSKAYLKDAQLQLQVLRADDYYEANDIALMRSCAISRIDLVGSHVELENGDKVPYSKLCIATGARPRPLGIPGIDASGIYELRNADEADILRAAARVHRQVVVVGGGFIGLEAAATLHGLGLDVSVVEAAPRLMGRAVAREISQFVLEKYRALGIKIFLDTPVSEIENAEGAVCSVRCGDKKLPADMVLIGIGVVPNDELASDAGILTGNGIHVDLQLNTSAPNVYAIGDVANYEHWMVGARVRLESVQNATDQAKCLAGIVAGGDEDYNAVPWFWSEQADMKLQMVGLSHNSKTTVMRENPDRGAITVFHFDDDDKMIAIDTINAPADHMAGRKLLEKGISLSREQAGDNGFSLKSLLK